MTWPRPCPATTGEAAEAPSQPTVKCLFCSHLNPADASYCNDCGSQLHLQPCERCGVLNLRTASNCYKCGAGLTLQAAPVTDPPSPSALHANQPAHAGVSDAVVTKRRAPVSDAGALPVAVIATTDARAAVASQRTWWAATAAILPATIAKSGYYYVERSPEFRQRLGANPSDPRMASARAGTPIST